MFCDVELDRVSNPDDVVLIAYGCGLGLMNRSWFGLYDGDVLMLVVLILVVVAV